jgi:hypothetical protein
VIAHVVLLAPRPDLATADRASAIATLTRAVGAIPEIRRSRIGRRVMHGLPGYERLMAHDYEIALLLEFDDVDALKRYLAAPAHAALSHLFSTTASAALAYDFEIVDGPAGASLWRADE